MLNVPTHLKDNFLTEETAGRIERIAAGLPVFFSTVQVYELHLSKTLQRIDLSTVIGNNPADREAFVRWIEGMRSLYAEPEWDVLKNLALAWYAEPDDFADMQHLWLEFDLTGKEEDFPIPSLVAGFVPGTPKDRLYRSIINLASYLPLLQNEIARSVERILKAWEGNAGSCSFSYMLSRHPGNRFRILTGAEQQPALDQFTRDLPETPAAGRFTTLANHLLSTYPGPFRLEFNADEKGILQDRAIHVFCHLHPGKASALLEELQNAGLCTEGQFEKATKLATDCQNKHVQSGRIHLLAVKVLYHSDSGRLRSKAYFRQMGESFN